MFGDVGDGFGGVEVLVHVADGAAEVFVGGAVGEVDGGVLFGVGWADAFKHEAFGDAVADGVAVVLADEVECHV